MLEITIKQTGFNEYSIKSANGPMPLPLDILTSDDNAQIILTGKWEKIKSSFPPVADPKGYYLKTITTD